MVTDSTRLMNSGVFSHVKINPNSIQTLIIRLQRYTTEPSTEHNIGKEQSGEVSRAQQGSTSRSSSYNVSLADISKPVPFNTHQLVCRLQSRGTRDKKCLFLM